MLRSLLIELSTHKAFRSLAETSSVGRRLSRRFVAGMTGEEAIAVAAQLNREGMEVSLDSLGESVTSAEQSRASAHVYHRLLEEIALRGLRANISVKLTQMGMDIAGEGPALAERLVGEMVDHAAQTKNFVRIDMESAQYTERTLGITERLHAHFPGSVGTVLQAYLYRTADDMERLLAQKIRIRLCKGAYKEPAEIAFPAKADVDANYARLMQHAVTSGTFCGIATHDEVLIERLCQFVESNAATTSKQAFEFQMLYGIRRDLQRKLVAAGYRVRVYVPFGPEWYPYFMRRLAERPANLLFLARNVFRN